MARRGWVALGRVAVVVAAGALACDDSPTEPGETPLGDWVSVSAGASHACALNSNGSAWCWGDNTWGQFGNATDDASAVPVPAAGERTFTALAAAGDHTCGFTEGGDLLCWGRNDVAELGISTPFSLPVPEEVAGGPYDRLHAGFYASCGTNEAGGVECWGGSRWVGSLPVAADATCPGYYAVLDWPCTRSPTAFDTGVGFQTLDMGLFFGCGRTDADRVACFGMNDFGQLGTEAAESCSSGGAQRPCATSPVVVSDDLTVQSVATGDIHACALDSAGAAWCWGAQIANFGELGTGVQEGAATPTAVMTEVRFRDVWAAKGNSIGGHTCGLDDGGAAWCWGHNEEGGVGATSPDVCTGGANDVPCALSPVAVSGGLTFEQLSLGRRYSCGLVSGGADVYCWGRNDLGQLGDGTTVGRSEPQAVALP